MAFPAIFDKYRIFAVARLDTVGFEYSPEGDVQQEIRLGKGLTWRWSIKSQEAEPQQLIIRLRLHYEPKGENEPRSDDEIWSESFNIKVTKNLFESLFGSQASIYTGFTFITGAVLSIFSVWEKFRSATAVKKSP